MTPKTFTAVPLPRAENVAASKRAVIEFGGLDQSGIAEAGGASIEHAGEDLPVRSIVFFDRVSSGCVETSVQVKSISVVENGVAARLVGAAGMVVML